MGMKQGPDGVMIPSDTTLGNVPPVSVPGPRAIQPAPAMPTTVALPTAPQSPVIAGPNAPPQTNMPTRPMPANPPPAAPSTLPPAGAGPRSSQPARIRGPRSTQPAADPGMYNPIMPGLPSHFTNGAAVPGMVPRNQGYNKSPYGGTPTIGAYSKGGKVQKEPDMGFKAGNKKAGSGPGSTKMGGEGMRLPRKTVGKPRGKMPPKPKEPMMLTDNDGDETMPPKMKGPMMAGAFKKGGKVKGKVKGKC